MLTASSDVHEQSHNRADGDHGPSPRVDQVTNMLETVGLRKVSGLGDSASLSKGLPATATLPSLTIDADPSLVTAPKCVVTRPREKLVTVLRKADRLLREHERARDHDLLQKSRLPAKRGRMEAFIMSLKEETIKKSQQRNIRSESDRMKRRLADLVPTEVLSRRPKLSTDNLPGNELEIVFEEDGDSAQAGKSGDSRNVQVKPSRVTPRAVAPKLKPASIAKLNAELDRKIKEQHAHDQPRRKQARPMNSRSRDSIDKEDVDTEGGDEFGEADEGELRTEEETAFEAGDLPELAAIEQMPLLSDNEVGGRPVGQLDFGKRRRPRLSFKDEHEHDTSEDDPLYALDAAEATGEDVKTMNLEDAQLSLMLSGQFVNKAQGEESDRDILRSTGDEDERGEYDDDDDEEEGEGEEGLTEKIVTEFHSGVDMKTSLRGGGFFEEEAEDEDSQVSADDIDEEAIARDLKASRFLADNTDDEDGASEGDPTLRDSQRVALYRQLMEAEEEEEMQMFINRFVPDEVLREQGVYAELRRKYQSTTDCPHDESDWEDRDRSRGGLSQGAKSKFGILSTISESERAHSHPEFLKLIEQDRLSNDDEEESEEQSDRNHDHSDQDEMEKGEYIRQDEDLPTMGRTICMESTMNTLLENSSVVISAISAVSALIPAGRKTGAARGFVRPDESLCNRLMGGDHQADGTSVVTRKANARTFETVSSRPKISKEKILSKSKK